MYYSYLEPPINNIYRIKDGLLKEIESKPTSERAINGIIGISFKYTC